MPQRKTAIGKATVVSGRALDKEAMADFDDIASARERWHQDAPVEFRDLIDARVVAKHGVFRGKLI